MPRKDTYHDTVKAILEKEGWTITHDPLTLPFGGDSVFIDLGAETPVAAEKGERKIVVAIKSFLSSSKTYDLEQALGQFRLYRYLLLRQEPERALYLAIPSEAFAAVFNFTDAVGLIESEDLRLLVFKPEQEIIEQWIPE